MNKESSAPMVKECLKKCSKCGQLGHIYTTCDANSKSVMVFGIDLSKRVEKQPQTVQNSSPIIHEPVRGIRPTYGEVYCVGGLRKESWTVEERYRFLVGIEKLGRGNWREISKYYVPTKTPIQVASHAQKHFNRLDSAPCRNPKHRTSIFDLTLDSIEPELLTEIVDSARKAVVDQNEMQTGGMADQCSIDNRETTTSDCPSNISSSSSQLITDKPCLNIDLNLDPDHQIEPPVSHQFFH